MTSSVQPHLTNAQIRLDRSQAHFGEHAAAYATQALVYLGFAQVELEVEALEVQREIAKQARIANLVALFTAAPSVVMTSTPDIMNKGLLRTRLEAELGDMLQPPRVQDER